MLSIKSALNLALAASLLCTACVGNVTGAAEEPKSNAKELVSDVKAEQVIAADGGPVLAKRAVHQP